MEFSTIEITSKKVRGKGCGFFDQRNYIEKLCANDVESHPNLVLGVSM